MTSEERRQKNLQKLQEFTLMDDDFMNACFSDNLGLTEFVLRIIMKKKRPARRSCRDSEDFYEPFGA